MSELLRSVDYGVPVQDSLTTVCSTNEEAFLKILTIYARPGFTIVDPTYGNGVFWKNTESEKYKILRSDLTTGINMKALPYPNESIEMEVIDPPYRYTPAKNKKHEDTYGHGKVDALYNLQEAKLHRTEDVLELYYAAMTEAYRILRHGGFLVLKCQDTVQDGQQFWVHVILMQKCEEMGFGVRELSIVAPPSVLKTRWSIQRHLRKGHSYFIVARKGGQFPFGIPSVCKRSSNG